MHFYIVEVFSYPIKLYKMSNSGCGVENLSAGSPLDPPKLKVGRREARRGGGPMLPEPKNTRCKMRALASQPTSHRNGARSHF